MINKKLSQIIFSLAVIIFFITRYYTLNQDFQYVLFWSLIIIIVATVIYQIFYIKNSEKFVLIEIFIFSILLFSVYQLGYIGLRGSDSYFDHNFLKGIVNNHYFSLDGGGVAGWPMIHIFSSDIALITDINLITIAKFIPLILSSLVILPLYLLIKKIFKDEKTALLSCLIYVTIPQFMRFHSVFVRQTYAFLIMIFFIFIIYKSKKDENLRLTFLSILFIPSIILGHHLTSMMMIVLLLIYIISIYVSPFIFKYGLDKKINLIFIFSLTVIATFSYWTYVTQGPIETLGRIFQELIMAKEGTPYATAISLDAPIVTLKGNIIFYGFFTFHFLFALLLLIKFFFTKNKQKIEDITFSMFFFLTMFYGFLGLYFISGGAFPQRMLSFSWLFGIIPLVTMLMVIKKPNYKKIFVIILSLFILFNIYNISDAYIQGSPESTGLCADTQDYIMAKTIKLPEDIEEYYGHISVVGAIYDIQLVEQRSVGKSIGSIQTLANFTNIIIINENRDLFMEDNLLVLKDKSIDNYIFYKNILDLKNNENINKICNLGTRYILKGVE